ncbi:alpha/beta fold hydrolase [Bradyrhizobium sp. SYSU BS000235]|uniref:alpha/beta fold hydrolase n=1 Tax=Bradyrhizobium sp. SYSU BS000235 TaxID=3411332 RepID=UPI003C764101
MSTVERLKARLASALDDAEYVRLGPSLSFNVAFQAGEANVRLVFENGRFSFVDQIGHTQIRVKAAAEAWDKVLQTPPPPTFHSFTALDLVNPEFSIDAEPLLLAQARPVLERLVERLIDAQPATRASPPRNLSQIEGRWHEVTIRGVAHEIYAETAGEGTPILFLHTAGADSRQFIAQLSDTELAGRFQMIAADLPFHGRSMPPRTWDGGDYKLDLATYRDWCAAILEQVVGRRAIVVGGSMGAAMTMVLAAERPELLLGVVAVEPPLLSKGRRNPFQHHVAVHGALHNASYVRGLMSPLSPESDRRRSAWIYSQGAPGIYGGDLAFYSDEFDGALTAGRIDAGQTPVALLSGGYDYSATPKDGRKLAELIPGSFFKEMPGLGHFPMCENPDLFRPYLQDALDHVTTNK